MVASSPHSQNQRPQPTSELGSGPFGVWLYRWGDKDDADDKEEKANFKTEALRSQGPRRTEIQQNGACATWKLNKRGRETRY